VEILPEHKAKTPAPPEGVVEVAGEEVVGHEQLKPGSSAPVSGASSGNWAELVDPVDPSGVVVVDEPMVQIDSPSDQSMIKRAKASKGGEKIPEAFEADKPGEEKPGQEEPKGKPAAPTQLAGHAPIPTMVETPEVVEASVGEGAPQEPAKPASKEPARPGGRAVPTQLAGKTPVTTQLAGPEALEEMGTPPEKPVKPLTMPNLELESSAKGTPPAEEVLDVQSAEEEVLDAQPAEEEVLDAQPASGDDLAESEAGSSVVHLEEIDKSVLASPVSKPREMSPVDVIEEDILVEGASEVDLGKEQLATSDKSSGLDIIAEALESGVDVEKPTKTTSGPRSGKGTVVAGEDEIDLEHAAEVGGSAVDLGAPMVKQRKGKEEVEEVEELESIKTESGLSLEKSGAEVVEAGDAVLETESSEAAESLEVQPRGKKKPTRKEVEEAVDEELLVTSAAEEEARGRGKAKKEKPRGRSLVGALSLVLLGILVAAGAGGLVWYLDLLPKSPNAAPEVKPRTDGMKLSNALKARQQIDLKNYDTAISMLSAPATDEDYSTRGEAIWLKYLAEKKDKLNPGDKEVKDARKDLEQAKNALLLHQINQTIAAQNAGKASKALEATLGQYRKALGEVEKELKIKGDESPKVDKIKAEIKRLAGQAKMASDYVGVLKGAKVPDKDLPPSKFRTLLINLKLDQGTVDDLMKLTKADKRDKLRTAVENLNNQSNKLDSVIKNLRAVGIKEGVDAPEGVNQLAKEKKDAIAAREKMKEEKDTVTAMLEKASKELEEDPDVKMAVKVAPRKDLPGAVKELIQFIKKSDDPMFKLKMTGEINTLKDKLTQRRSPEEMLEHWAFALQDPDRSDGLAPADAALIDAGHVSKGSDAKARARAEYIKGLAQRNQARFAKDDGREEKFDAARKTLQQAAKDLKAISDPWAEKADQALKELTDATVYFVPRIKKLEAQGQLDKALAETNLALAAVEDKGWLLALKGQLQLEKSKGALSKELENSIRKDAEAAMKSDASKAEALYTLGLLEERLGEFSTAADKYKEAQEAQKAHKGKDADLARYLEARGRVLLRAIETPPPESPKTGGVGGKDGKTSRLAPSLTPASPDESQLVAHPLTLLALTAVVAQIPGEDESASAEEAKKLAEAEEAARNLIALPDPKLKARGHMLLGKIYSRQGKKTEGLKEYALGIKLLFPESGKELEVLIVEHPAFKMPDSLAVPNPVLAEKHFGRGLDFFWAKNYAEAEEAFKEAVKFNEQDARYQYFLGMSRWLQKSKAKRADADWNFEKAVRLEMENRPSSAEVNASLERIQGPLRVFLSKKREKLFAAGS
jgi:hypothetical protein